MCGHCKHTGCWIFICIMMFYLAAKIRGQSICLQYNGSIPLDTISFTSPMISKIKNETNSTITEANLRIFIDNQKRISNEMSCPQVYILIQSFNATNGTADHEEPYGAFNVKPMVWIASIVAVIIISAVGLIGVAVVPLVTKSYYQQAIQFLVALAVGCLVGDAFLHLLPHAIAAGHAHEEAGAEKGDERETVLKGLVALAGIYIFFLAEKLVSTISEYRVEKQAEEEERERMIRNPAKASFEPRRLSTFRESISIGASVRRGSRLGNLPVNRRVSRASSLIGDEMLTVGLTSKAMKTVDILSAYAEEAEEEFEEDENDGNLTLKVPAMYPVIKTTPVDNESATSSPAKQVSYDHGHGHRHEHGHERDSHDGDVTTTDTGPKQGHSHGHSHEIPGSFASIAWMVIMGDGLHNFTDGMAIGVAFTAGIGSGISTSVAVFCHELPHELGDFAVLLKTGMKIKQALFFNIVSSVLCFIGMIIGIGVGNIASASSWVFALTAGIFVYIALVDMLPELNSFQVKPDQSRIVQLIIQNSGLITGSGIMLLIAMFEEQLHNLIA